MMGNYDAINATPESAVDAQIFQAQKNIHTALPAKIVSFNAERQTATLAIQITQLLTDGGTVQIPPLVDVPVSFPRGGGFAFTFPLASGDEGIAIFSERCIDGWWQSGKASEPLDVRLHDFSDAMFIPGICSTPNVISEFFSNGLSMQTVDANTYIRITNGGIQIKGDIEHHGNTSQNGEFSATGTISSDTDVLAAGVSGKTHKHRGDSGGKTGEPE